MNGSEESFDDLNDAGMNRLRDGLERLYAAPGRVPADIDRLILSSARAAIVRRGRMRLALRWCGGAAAAAAVLFLAIRFYPRPPIPAQPSPSVAAASGEDLNGDGKVDMLDAYLLARRIELKQQTTPAMDFNKDGIVDRKDADLIALDAVKLKPEGVQ